jgi:tRNA (adenine57-N1/adenine58-N1)-methyltransferase
MDALHEGDLVMLLSQDRKQFLVRLCRGELLQTHRGRILHDDLLSGGYGIEARSHLGYAFAVLEPSVSDMIGKLKRTTQIMFPKDIAYTLFRLNIVPGSRVIEAGTGSGGFALAAARLLGPRGRLYSYEVRADIQRLAQTNLDSLGLTPRVEFKLRDIDEGFDETGVDAVFLDLRSPWLYLPQVAAALKDSGFFGAILPTTNQVVRLLQGLEMQHSFGQIEVEEVLVRPYKAVPGRFRPLDRMVAHTGYLIFARKVSREVSLAGYWLDRRRRKHGQLNLDGVEDQDVLPVDEP